MENFLKKIKYKTTFNKIKKLIIGRNNIIKYSNSKLFSVIFDISGNNNTININDNCYLKNVIFRIRGDGHRVFIGKRCRFNRGANLWFEDNNCTLSIGQNSTFEDVHLALTEPNSKITIGHDCMFAYDIDVRTGDSHSIISRENNERVNYAENVTIGNHVWVAAHTILLKGVIISDDSVVATGSVVTGKFGSKGIIIGGNPSKKIKHGITWDRKRTYKDK